MTNVCDAPQHVVCRALLVQDAHEAPVAQSVCPAMQLLHTWQRSLLRALAETADIEQSLALQALRDNAMSSYMASKKTLEINASNPIMQARLARPNIIGLELHCYVLTHEP